MTLQQLKYVIQIVQSGSISGAAQKLFITQPSLSKAVTDLEKEMGITIFCRNNRGVYLSEEGTRFLAYARQVVEQAQLLEQKYKKGTPVRRVFAISAQHYAFVVNAFVELIKEYGKNKYEFSLRESKTFDIIEDVRTKRSELGILFLNDFNHDVMMRMFEKAELSFVPLFLARPHVFVSRKNPLAGKEKVAMADLQDYPRLTYEQGINNSFYFAEEPYSTEESPKSIVVTDRATLFNLLIGLNGYTICSGILSSDLNGTEIVSVPLAREEKMEIGYIHAAEMPLSETAKRYLEHLNKYSFFL
ncbi:Cys regulon transcriptional activator [uncultured Roseburia sp.]|uniref:LysR family transcriptional regulator n=1 Tax=Brotonthovivens ammoniilytica TaxID=2981725 RepID=A0ABT2TMN3_9FIRM|nr:LysR family transcriptional regulator [Brotonthovivens ammoniilytica]MCU6763468.1 LysR family transcriptional regulator [Brotonthovivens ammoniilytica]SCJ20343.1 Cys regulon transcriptional activator [uncultured Roseburia sp.]